MNQATNKIETSSNREWWVDYLRVIAVFLVIPFHVIISYVANAMGPGINFLVWNDKFFEGARIVFEFFNPWHMPLLFLLAGFSMVYSLRKRSYVKFISERVVRLGVPLIFGLFLLNVVMSWYSTKFIYEIYPFANPIWPEFPGFGMFYKNWWLKLGTVTTGGLGKINTSHLWFLVVLFILSLIAGAIVSSFYKYRKTNPEKSNVALEYLTHPAAIVFWASCSVLVKYIPALNTIGNLAGIFSVFQYNEVLFFVYGILLASSVASVKKIQKHWIWMLPMGFMLLILWSVFKIDYADNIYLSTVRNLGAWMFANGLIGVASKYLKKSTRGLKYFTKASMPVYILHLSLEIIVGYYLIRNPLNPVLEIGMLSVINAALCVGIYEFFRQINKVIPGIGLVLGIKEKQIWMKSKTHKKQEEITRNNSN